jgi:cobaltochelatase CobT
VGLIIRERLLGLDLPEPLSIQLSNHQDALWPTIGRYLTDLEQYVADQATFGRNLIMMFRALGLESEGYQQDGKSTDLTEKCEDPGINNQVAADTPEDRRSNPVGQHHQEMQDIEQSTEHNESSDQHLDHYQRHKRSTHEFISTTSHEQKDIPYRVYSREFDEEVTAASLCSTQELAKLRQRLDQQFPPNRRNLSHLSRFLQLHLRAQQYHSWDFDREEGELDPTRLSRVLTTPLLPPVFKTANQGDNVDTLVTILIDNSGSMRGKPITVSALCADMLAATLERCGIKVEILGFTTRSWHGGASRQKWLDNGCSPSPGRLSDLRHIIYKSADTPWRRSRNGRGLTQKFSLLKDNIDGEALLWAHQRMLCRPEQRQILMVIADGAPQDDATLSANGWLYLDHHLRRVIDFIETRSAIELVAIGIGHDITDYYQQAICLSNIDDLGLVMTKSLCKLFGQKLKRTHSRHSFRQV